MERNIVLIDNNFAIRELIKSVLNRLAAYNKQQFNLYSSQNGIEGLGFVYITQPEIVIIDTTLPKYSGNELLYFLLTNKKFHAENVKVIVLTEKKQYLRVPKNFTVIEKSNSAFVDLLLENVTKALHLQKPMEGRVEKLCNFIINWCNRLDVLETKFHKKNLLSKAFSLPVLILLEIFISIILTIALLIIGRVTDANVKQEKRDLAQLRRKHYPTTVASISAVLLGIVVLGSFIFSQNVLLNKSEEQTSALGTIYWYSFMTTIDDITNPFKGSPAQLLNGASIEQFQVSTDPVEYEAGVMFNADNEVMRINNPVLNSDYSINKGAVELFYRPNEASTVDKELTFFSIFYDNNNKIEFKKLNDGSDSLALSYICPECGQATEKISGSNYSWSADEIIKFRLEWDTSAKQSDQLKIFVNDVLPASTQNSTMIFGNSMQAATAIYVGNSSPTGTTEVNGFITTFSIYSEGFEPTPTPIGTPGPTPIFIQNSGEPSWYSNMNNVSSITSPAVGIGPGSLSGGAFVDGAQGYGNAYKFESSGDSIDVDLSISDYSLVEGAIEFYYKPFYESNHDAEINLFSLRTDDNNEIRLYKKPNSSNNVLAFSYNCPTTCSGEEIISEANYGSYWNVGEWIFIRVTWNQSLPLASQLQIFINSNVPTSTNQTGNIDGVNFQGEPDLFMGNRTTSGANPALGAMDEFKVFTDTVIPTPTITPTPSPSLTPSPVPTSTITPTPTAPPLFYSTMNNQAALDSPVFGAGQVDMQNITFVDGYLDDSVKFGTLSNIEFDAAANNINKTKGKITFYFKSDYYSFGGRAQKLFSIRRNQENIISLVKSGSNGSLVFSYIAKDAGATNYNELVVQQADYSWDPYEWNYFELFYDISIGNAENQLRLFLNGQELKHTHTSNNKVTTAMVDPTRFFIGNTNASDLGSAYGTIDDFKIYSNFAVYPTSTPVINTPTPTPVQSESILWWSTMDSAAKLSNPEVGTGMDDSGGVVYGFYPPSPTPGYRLSAHLDDANDFIRIPIQSTDYNPAKGKVEFYFNPTANNATGTRVLFLLRNTGTDEFLRLRREGGDLVALWDTNAPGFNDRTVTITNATLSSYFVVGNWVKVAVIWDTTLPPEQEANKIEIYLNDVKPSQTVAGIFDSDMAAWGQFLIGNISTANSQSARGKFDEFKIWGVGAGISPTPTPSPYPTTPASPIWYSTLNNATALTTPVVGKGATSSSVTYESGVNGDGVRIDASNEHITVASIPDTQFIKSQGAIEFYYKPDSEETVASNLVLFNVGSDTNNYLRLTKQVTTNNLFLEYKISGTSKTLTVPVANYQNIWQLGQWLIIRVEWDESQTDATKELKLFLNTVAPTPTVSANQFTAGTGTYSLVIGNTASNGTTPAKGVIDEFSIYGDPNSRNYIVNDTGDATDSNIGDKICATSGSVCTLRAAIAEANASTAWDKISFKISGGGVKVITPATVFPALTYPVSIEGTTQDGMNCTTPNILIAINGQNIIGDGLVFNNSNNSVKGLAVYRFVNGLKFTGSTNSVTCNIIGLNADGQTPAGNTNNGIYMGPNSNNNIIGTSAAADRNIVSANNKGIFIENSNNISIAGNYIGTDVNGVIDLGNTAAGIELVGVSDSTIGGTVGVARETACQGECNLISGNDIVGIKISSTSASNNDIDILGNYIGLNKIGTGALNTNYGIIISKMTATPPDKNVIDNNVISASTISVYAASSTTQTSNISELNISNNYIGTNKNGTAVIKESQNGITINAGTGSTISTLNIENNTIGGAMRHSGLHVYGSGVTGMTIKNNKIGRNSAGTALSNDNGIWFDRVNATAPNNAKIGGSSPSDGNIIADNTTYGLYLANSSNVLVTKNVIENNDNDGISISGDGSTLGSVNNTIYENSIYNNAKLGINLRAGNDVMEHGVTYNDPDDSDTTADPDRDGPNDLQNYPVLIRATYSDPNLSLYGKFRSKPNKNYRLHFYGNDEVDLSGFGEGQTYIGYKDIKTGADGIYDFSQTPVTFTSAGLTADFFSSTATECSDHAVPATGCNNGLFSTSEFGLSTNIENLVIGKGLSFSAGTNAKLFIAAEGAGALRDLYAFNVNGDGSLSHKVSVNTDNTTLMSPMAVVGLDDNYFAGAGLASTNQYRVYSLDTGALVCGYNIANDSKSVDLKVANNTVGSKYIYIASEAENAELTLLQGESGEPKLAKYGQYLSEVKDMSDGGPVPYFHSITWDQTLPVDGGNVKIQLRSGNSTDLSNEEWYGPDGTRGSYFEHPGDIIPAVVQGKSHLQYRLLLDSAHQVTTPSLNSITIRYGK